MGFIRKLKIEDVDDFFLIIQNAFCGSGFSEDLNKQKYEFLKAIVKDFPDEDLYGYYRYGKLLGGMRLIDYKINLLGVKTTVGGIGIVAVDLLHKKEKVALELMRYSCQYFDKKNVCMTALYPFNVGFYKKMGFGYGTKIEQYRIKPESFPFGYSKKNICFLNESNKDEIIECYNKVLNKTHGMMEKVPRDVLNLFKGGKQFVGYRVKGILRGYIQFSFDTEYPFKNNIVINEFIYENREVLKELSTFLHTQKDQFYRVIFNTTNESFQFLLGDPSNGRFDSFNSMNIETAVKAVGIMYRVINVETLFNILRERNFNNQNCRLKITLIDLLYENNNKSLIVSFKEGFAKIDNDPQYDVEVIMDISNFSSLIMGAVNYLSLYDFNLSEISNTKYINIVNDIFRTRRKPICTNMF